MNQVDIYSHPSENITIGWIIYDKDAKFAIPTIILKFIQAKSLR